MRRGGRAVEYTGLENRHTRKGIGGSNPSLSAIQTRSSAPLRTGSHLAGRSSGGGDIALRRVIHDHAIGVEAPTQRTDRAFHALDPAARQAVAVALVVAGSLDRAKYATGLR